MQPSNMMLERLRKLAAGRRSIPEGDTVDDYAAGNVDDAYAMGVDHGEAGLAAAILEDLARGE